LPGWTCRPADDYWDGLWLAFVTGTTVGYGNVVLTTGAARVVSGVYV
jgi:uncharacterized membrane protein